MTMSLRTASIDASSSRELERFRAVAGDDDGVARRGESMRRATSRTESSSSIRRIVSVPVLGSLGVGRGGRGDACLLPVAAAG